MILFLVTALWLFAILSCTSLAYKIPYMDIPIRAYIAANILLEERLEAHRIR